MNLDDPILTAYALGELAGDEHAADRRIVEALLSRSPEARAAVDDIRATAALAQSALALELTPGLTDDLRDDIFAAAQSQAAEDDARLAARSLRLSTTGAAKRTDVYHVITHPAPEPRRVRQYNWLAAAAAIAIVASLLTLVLSNLYKAQLNELASLNAKPTQPTAPTIRPGNNTAGPQPTASRLPDVEVETTQQALTAILPWNSDEARNLPFGIGPSITVAPLVAAGPTTRESGGAGPAVAGAYAVTIENPFMDVSRAPLSSFAVNVGTGSFDAVRKALAHNRLPDRNAVRIEELLNAFPYHYEPPKGGKDFAANIEIASCPWQQSHRLVRIGLKARDLPHDALVAKNLNIGVEFNPALVSAYRLVGYDRHVVTRPDRDADAHRNDVHGGQAVTALYEVIPVAGSPLFSFEDELKYQKPRELTPAAQTHEFLSVKLAYADPRYDTAKTQEFTAHDLGHGIREASADFRFAAAVATFGMVLRDSPHRGDATLDAALQLAQGSLQLAADEATDERTQFINLIHHAKTLKA